MNMLLAILYHSFRRPPHGGRGLKYDKQDFKDRLNWSPSPRRAWIEIVVTRFFWRVVLVALPTEGVD